MNEMKIIEEKRALREVEASRLHEELREMEEAAHWLVLENQRLRRELRAANRGNQRLSLAIKAGRALAEAQATVEKLEVPATNERIGIDLVDYHYRVVLTSPGGLSTYRSPEGVWSSGWASGFIISTGLENMHIAEDEARRQSALRGIPCVGDCDPPGIVCSVLHSNGAK